MAHSQGEKVNNTKEPLNLTVKREEFLETFFSRGAEFTTELLKEVQSLKEKVRALTEENAALHRQLASDDAIKELLIKIKQLEEEKKSLCNRIDSATDENQDYVGRYREVENELDMMANLYVVSYQLHATLEPREVLSVIEQMLMQFVGAGSFAIFLRYEKDDKQMLGPVHIFQHDQVAGTNAEWGVGPIGESASTQVNYIGDPSQRVDADLPLACIPMILGQETIGVIVIYGLLEQKKEFVDVDFELFKLLALHAASAIIGAGLMAKSDGVISGLSGYSIL